MTGKVDIFGRDLDRDLPYYVLDLDTGRLHCPRCDELLEMPNAADHPHERVGCQACGQTARVPAP